MSASVRDRQDSPEIELGTAISWPAVYAAIGLAFVMILAVCTLFLFFASHTKAVEEWPLVKKPVVPLEKPAAVVAGASEARRLPQQALPRPALVDVVTKEPFPPTAACPLAGSVPEPAPVAAAMPPPARQVVAHKPAPVLEAVAAQKPPPPPLFKRRQLNSEVYLRNKLALEARELDVETEKGTSAKLLEAAKIAAKAAVANRGRNTETSPAEPPVLDLIGRRADLKGLPVRKATECRVPAREAVQMVHLPLAVRRITAQARARDDESDPDSIRVGDRKQRPTDADAQLAQMLVGVWEKDDLWKEYWKDEVGVRLATQMLQAEGPAVRQQLVKKLASIKGNTAGDALARRAVFDLSPEIREEAINALKTRPQTEYRGVLLETLRYPWGPVADHAAEAVVNLGAREMVPDLLLLLDQPDPQAPRQDKDRKWVKAELVRVNHFGNCLLCHSPSCDGSDPVRGLIPVRGEPIPVEYYGRPFGSFIRADITYLKQDFSAMQSVAKPDKWPAEQRFDFIIRQREITAADVPTFPAGGLNRTEPPTTYPQREAVLWALRELSGKDAGQKTADWRQMFLDIWPKEKF
jgi:hypothetical protein